MRSLYKNIFLFIYTILIISFLYSEGNISFEDPLIEITQRRHATIIWGTDNEVINLIKELDLENSTDFNKELLELLYSSKSLKISDAILNYFSKIQNISAKNFVLRILEDRNNINNASVEAAINYVSALKIVEALPFLRDILDSEESRFLSSAVKAIGSCGYADDSIVLFMLDYLENRFPSELLKSDLIFALGELKSVKAIAFLTTIAENTDEKSSKRILAIEALGKIAFSDSVDSILRIIQDSDANVRLFCYSTLSSFNDKRINNQILQGFRDSYYKIRMISSKLSGEKILIEAVPFLIYRIKYDDVQAVKEESIKALGLIANMDSEYFLNEYFNNKNLSDKNKILIADALIKINTKKYLQQIIAAYDDAKSNNKQKLQSGLANIFTKIIDKSLFDLTSRLIISDDIIEKNYGLDLAILNLFTEMTGQIEIISSNEKTNTALVLKANKFLKAIKANQKSLTPGASIE